MSAPLIAERLQERREALGINKITAAKMMGVTQSGYLRYESGERKPTIQVVEAMAACLSTSVGYLTGETDDPSPDRILVHKEEQPVLFEIAQGFPELSKTERRRLLAYYKKLTE